MSLDQRRQQKRLYMQKWRAEHPEHIEKYRLWAKNYYKEDNTRYLNYARRGALKQKYGLSIEDYEAKLAAQSGVCAICGNPPKRYRLAVDHNHRTGKIRALLCGPCNLKIGVIENESFVDKAKTYLEAHDV